MDRELRVLIVEDSAADAELITKELGKGGLVHTSKMVKSKDEFLKALGEYTPDIILCDYAMPGFGAPEALEIAKKISPEIPFVVVSGAIGEDVAVEIVKSGAVDYVMKDKILRLPMVVTRALKENEDCVVRKSAAEAFRNSEERFRAIFDHANDGILLADEETKNFYTVNNTACQMLGYSLEEIKNIGVPDIHPKEDLPYVMEQFGRQVRGEIALAKDLPVKRKDGSVFYADVNTSLVTLAGRKYLLGIFRDVTERKKMEEEMRKRLQELEEFYKASVGREERILELKKEIEQLKKELGK